MYEIHHTDTLIYDFLQRDGKLIASGTCNRWDTVELHERVAAHCRFPHVVIGIDAQGPFVLGEFKDPESARHQFDRLIGGQKTS